MLIICIIEHVPSILVELLPIVLEICFTLEYSDQHKCQRMMSQLSYIFIGVTSTPPACGYPIQTDTTYQTPCKSGSYAYPSSYLAYQTTQLGYAHAGYQTRSRKTG